MSYMWGEYIFKKVGAWEKICYMGHIRFLPQAYFFCKQKKAFNGKAEHVRARQLLSGTEVIDSLSNLDIMFVKGIWTSSVEGVWKRKSIFFDLLYWKELLVHHNLDVIHTKKKV